MANRIEAATSGRSKCMTCGAVIEKGTARLAEQYLDSSIPKLIHRYYHVRCAAAVHPELVKQALDNVQPGAVFDRAEIEAKIAARIAHAAEQRREQYEAKLAERRARAPKVATDDTTRDLLDQLEADPDDAGTLSVLADQLQAQGDVRGELISIQLTLATVGPGLRRLPALPDDEDDEDDDEEDDDETTSRIDPDVLARRRNALLEQLSAGLDSTDRVEWGIGYIRRLELSHKLAARVGELSEIWTHPSLRVLQDLTLALSSSLDIGALARLADDVPRSVRRLTVALQSTMPLTGLPALIAALPRLESLSIKGRAEYEALAHPRLAGITAAFVHALGEPVQLANRLSPQALPALTSLSFTAAAQHVLDAGPAGRPNERPNERPDELPAGAPPQPATFVRVTDNFDDVSDRLASRWLSRLHRLAMLDGTLTNAGVAALRAGLDGRILERLDLTGTAVPPAARPALAALCKELVLPAPTVEPGQATWVEHANKPEWGRGKVVRYFGGKLEVQFPGHGVKVFKADAPFLKLGV